MKPVEQGCDPYSAPCLHRLFGLFHSKREAPDLVEAHRASRTSIEIASAQGARSERLLSALALAKLPSQSRENLANARHVLAAAFEGFETETEFSAVAEARALLADPAGTPQRKRRNATFELRPKLL